MFSDMLSEIRAYGEGFLIVEQVPERLIADAVKNTNLKIVHRLVSRDDREAISGCMNLKAPQAAMISRLRPGQAIISGDGDDSAFWVKIKA
jgi:DNA helicase HerA-like ATPase